MNLYFTLSRNYDIEPFKADLRTKRLISQHIPPPPPPKPVPPPVPPPLLKFSKTNKLTQIRPDIIKSLIDAFYEEIDPLFDAKGTAPTAVFQVEATKILKQLFSPYIEYNDLIANAFDDIKSNYKELDTSDIYKEIDDRSNKFYESLPKTTGAGKQIAHKTTSYNKEMRDFVRTYYKKRNLRLRYIYIND